MFSWVDTAIVDTAILISSGPFRKKCPDEWLKPSEKYKSYLRILRDEKDICNNFFRQYFVCRERVSSGLTFEKQ